MFARLRIEDVQKRVGDVQWGCLFVEKEKKVKIEDVQTQGNRNFVEVQ